MGCRTVYALLHSEGLERFYSLRGVAGVAPRPPSTESRAWLEPIAARVTQARSGTRVALDVQGIHCSGCVWLLERLFARMRGARHLVVNPALGQLQLLVTPEFPLAAWVGEVERFGYRLGPARKSSSKVISDTLIRLGVTCALAANSMLFSASIYVGLDSGPLFLLFRRLNYGLGVAAFLVGAPPFVRSAIASVRRRVPHMDIPIALAMVLGFAGSSWVFFAGVTTASYLDSLVVFIALMLLGRYLQQSVLERHQHFLLSDPGLESVMVRRLTPTGTEIVPCGTISCGDELLLAPGEMLFVDATSKAELATLTLEWIDGESEPRTYRAGESIPAGASNAGREVVRVVAQQPLAQSAVVELLKAPGGARRVVDDWWRRLSLSYVTGVLALAAIAWGVWTALAGVAVGLEVATTVLVVSCPCAFGIAAPLAYELALAGLRRAGLVVRRPDVLDRLLAVKRIVFDKTGTLTSGRSELRDDSSVLALDATQQNVLFTLVAQSSHPKSAAISDALAAANLPQFLPELLVREHAGQGLETCHDGRSYRLGEPAWASGGAIAAATDQDVQFWCDNTHLATFATQEQLRPNAHAELARLQHLGFETWILSGDSSSRTQEVAREVGIAPERALGGYSPQDKEAFLERHDHGDTLTLGDGVNDSLAISRSHCSGTPSVERPFIPARSDFYLVVAGLEPIGLVLRVAQRLRRVVKQNLWFALTYNAIAVGLALGGTMRPWLAAVLMPVSSLSVVALTSRRLSRGAPLWK